MKRSVVFYAVAYALSLCAYWVALRIGFGFADSLDAPGWWIRLFGDLLRGMDTWRALMAILAIFVVSVPIGLAITRLVRPHAILIAVSSALTLSAVLISPWLILGGLPKLSDGIALGTIAVAPALVVSLVRLLPSNHRWRGP